MSLRVAVVGAGRIAQASHLPAWRRCEGARVEWVVDRDPTAARRLADEWRIPSWGADVAALASSPEIDAVDICTPASTHVPLATAFLEAGKHVLIEKPPALTMPDLDRLITLAERNGRIAMVAENWVFSAAFRTARRLVDGGETGRILVLEAVHESPFWTAPLTPPRPDSDGLGYLFAAGSHTVHAARVLVGDVTELAAFGTFADASADPPCDHELVLAARTSSGALASMSFAGRSHHEGPRRLWFRLIGEKAVLQFDIWSGWVEVSRPEGSHRIEHESPRLGFEEEIEHFVSCVRSDTTPSTSLREYRYTLATVLGGYRSAMEHRVVRPSEILEGTAMKEEVRT